MAAGLLAQVDLHALKHTFHGRMYVIELDFGHIALDFRRVQGVVGSSCLENLRLFLFRKVLPCVGRINVLLVQGQHLVV